MADKFDENKDRASERMFRQERSQYNTRGSYGKDSGSANRSTKGTDGSKGFLKHTIKGKQ